jgi:23S rRNA (adenine1618-N6)-methyltransferase
VLIFKHKLALAKKNNSKPSEKFQLHPRNIHRTPYQFEDLMVCHPPLSKFVFTNKFNNQTIDFSNQEAVKALNTALIKHNYNLIFWDIPNNFLCPPIPGRADYIHYLADLLASSSGNNSIPRGNNIIILDIGVGANCVYPLIGNAVYGWSFIGSDISTAALKAANTIIENNIHLQNNIKCCLQNNHLNIFHGIIDQTITIEATMCNPPFHSSAEKASAGTNRKWKNLGKQLPPQSTLNFGGQHNELWCKGGESAFIRHMIFESVDYKFNCKWFTTLVSNKEHLEEIYKLLKKVNAKSVKTITMSQGQKTSRIVAWSFIYE